MADLLEYIVRVRGGPEAAAQVRAVGAEFATLDAEASKAAASTTRAGERSSAAMAGLTRMAKYGALALAATGFEALKMGVNFDAAMERIHTQAGATQAEVNNLRGAVLDLSGTATKQGPQALAEGLYHLESVGLRGARAMDALKVAAQGADVGNANLEDTATALGSAWLVNIKGAGDLHHVMGLLNAAVGAGNMRMGDLVQALGTGVLPASKQAGLGIKDVLAALAVFTDEGYNASSAAAQFSTALHFFYNPTAKAQGALQSLGMTSTQMAQDMRKPDGLLVALRDLHDHLALLPGGAGGIAAEQALGSILPGGRGRIMLTLLNQLDRYQMKLHQVGAASTQFSADVRATHETAAYRLAAAWAKVQSNLISMGDSIKAAAVPALVVMTGALAGVISTLPKLLHIMAPLIAAFVTYKGVLIATSIAEALVANAGTLAAFLALIPAITGVTDVMVLLDAAFLANPVGLIAAGIVALGVALVELATHWHAVKDAAKDTLHWLVTAFKNTVGFLIGAWDSLHFTLPKFNTHIPGIGTIGGGTVGMPHIANPFASPPAANLPRPRKVDPVVTHGAAGIFGAPGDIVLKVDGNTLARVNRRAVQGAQARGG